MNRLIDEPLAPRRERWFLFHRLIWLIPVAAALFATGSVVGDEVILNPSADTSIMEVAPTNNMGGELYFNAGSNMHLQRNRGLLRFDLSGIPLGSRIDSATLAIRAVRDPVDGPTASIFDLHRLLVAWGEGDKMSNTSGAGRGSPAGTNEATWLDRFAFANAAWTTPGAAETNDFVSASSAEQFIVDVSSSPYYFYSAQLTADVQLWLDNPGTNFGWLLKTRDETTASTARRFASREDESNAPELTIDFTPPPPIQITDVGVSDGRLRFSFQAKKGKGYAIEFCQSLPASSWSTLAILDPPPTDTTVVVYDSLAANRKFFRIRLL